MNLSWLQNWVTKLRWLIVGAIPVLVALDEIWDFMSPSRLNQVLASLAALGLLSKGQATDELGASDKALPPKEAKP